MRCFKLNPTADNLLLTPNRFKSQGVRIVMIVTRFCIYLSVFTLVSGTVSLNQIKKCPSVDCPTDNPMFDELTDGPVYRYSKNAANFQEAKRAPATLQDPSDLANGELRLAYPMVGHIHNIGSVLKSSPPENSPTEGKEFHVQKSPPRENPQQFLRAEPTPEQQEQNKPHQARSQLEQQQQEQHPFQQVKHQRQQKQGSGLQQEERTRLKDLSTSNQIPGRTVPDQPYPQEAKGVGAVEDSIYWSASVEEAIPRGLSDADAERWMRHVRNHKVVRVENATREKCGNGKNRHVVFDDGSTSCARYREPMAHFVLGDLYCYYLARILGLDNVPTVVLSKVSFQDRSSQWSLVVDDVRDAGWTDNTMASFSLWVDHLGTAYLPHILFVNQHKSLTPSSPAFAELNLTQLVELAQFSDLVVFDYITAHLDRMTIRKNAVDYYKMDSLYEGEVHNLAQHQGNGGLWFIDNENGIFNAYAVAYGYKNKAQLQGYIEEVLHSMCIFRRSTVAMVNRLAEMDDPFQFLNQTVQEMEPAAVGFDLSARLTPFHIGETFKKRVAEAARWIAGCKSLSSRPQV